jgi:two-component system chemotaxis response regulator CheB
MSRILVIGASSGGPPALFRLLPRFPQSFPYPIVVVQHMPPGFTGPMAELLDEHSALTVREARVDDTLQPGLVLVAPAPYHLYVVPARGTAKVSLSSEPKDSLCSPRIDCAMESAAALYRNGVLGVVLSGMSAGQDCIRGAAAIRSAGGKVIAQDESSSVCYGMPQGVVKAGLSNREVPIGDMHKAIFEIMGVLSP